MTDDIGTAIATAIKRRRGDLGLSLDEVAKRAGTSKSHIWELEQGRGRNPTVSMALALCGALSISLDGLLGRPVSQPIFTEDEMAMIAAHRSIFGRKEQSE